MHKLIDRIRRQNGQTVVLCTHHLDEAERLCDRLAIINQGCLLAFGSLDELRQQLVPEQWVDIDLWQTEAQTAQTVLQQVNGVVQVKIAPDHILHIKSTNRL